MKRIFRSIINIKKSGVPTLSKEELGKNYRSFLISKVRAESPSDTRLYTWIEAHYRIYKELPSLEFLFEKAQAEGDEVVLAALKDISTQIPYSDSDYKAILKQKYEEQSREEFRNLVQNTWTVADSGLKINKKKEIKGIFQAIEYFTSESRKYRLQGLNIKTASQVRSEIDCKEVLEEYDKRKKDPYTNIGLYTDLEKIDTVFRGTKLGELFIIAAYVAQGKTTMAANVAYSGISQGLNGLFVAMEMNFGEMRDMFYCLHTSNPDWYTHHKFKNLCGKISYEKICYGELDDLEHEFFEAASKDFHTKDGFGEFFINQPNEHLTPSGLEMMLYDYQAELAERGKTLDFVVIDYVGLMVQDKNERYGDYNIDLNNIIKKLKNLCINFNNGRGMRIITPFQVNREGWKEAVKNDGVYKLTALSNANEAERAADHVIALFMNEEMKKNGLMKICCLKNRKGMVFAPFEACIDFICRKIRDVIYNKKSENEDGVINAIPLDISG